MTKKNSDPDAMCDHDDRFQRRVTSLPDEIKWKPEMGMRSVWVCARPACVLDAMAWVARGECGSPIVYDADRQVVTA